MSNRKRWLPIVVVAIFLLLGGLTWALYPRESESVVRMKELLSQMADENLAADQRQALRDEMREMRDNLSEKEREQVFRAGGEQFRQQMDNRIREFAKLPENERRAFLDRDIDRMESMRREFQQRAAGQGDQRGPGFGPGGPGGVGGPGGRGNWTDENRQDRRRRRLDNTSPEQRAYMTEYFKALNERRIERGLEPFRPRMGGGGRPRA